jgi:hypothetical protein
VALLPPTLNAAKTAEPTTRIWDVVPSAPTSTCCPICSPSARKERCPRAISPGPAGARPASRVRNPFPLSWSSPIAGTVVLRVVPGAARLTCP